MRSLLTAARRILLGALLASAVLAAGAALVVLLTGDATAAAVLAALALLLAAAAGAEQRSRRAVRLAERSERRLKALARAVQETGEAHTRVMDELGRVRQSLQDVTERQDQALVPVREDLADARRALAEAKRNTQIATVIEGTALLNLFTLLQPQGTLPAPTDFSAMPSTMLEIVTHVLALPHDPLVVECGSGASTVWFALACRRRGTGRVVAVEHDAHYAQQTRAALERCGVADWAEVRHAPIEPLQLGEEQFHWYAAAGREGLRDIDVLFVDGPPGRTGPLARYPALPVLAEALSDGSLVVMDDARRDDEAAALTRWLDETGGRLQRLRTPGRTAFLRWSAAPPSTSEGRTV